MTVCNVGGLGLGMFIFVKNKPEDKRFLPLLAHEYGHIVQSMICGPLFLPLVGLPSLLWSKRYGKHRQSFRNRGIKYTSRFPEKQANRLGQWATHDAPMDG